MDSASPSPDPGSARAELETLLRSKIADPDLETALPAVYEEVQDMAASYLRRERSSHTLPPSGESLLIMQTRGNPPSAAAAHRNYSFEERGDLR